MGFNERLLADVDRYVAEQREAEEERSRRQLHQLIKRLEGIGVSEDDITGTDEDFCVVYVGSLIFSESSGRLQVHVEGSSIHIFSSYRDLVAILAKEVMGDTDG